MQKNVLGDSISAGYGVGANGYVGLFAYQNSAVNNASAGDMARSCTALTPSFTDQENIIMVGTNDARIYGNDPAKLAIFEKWVRHMAVWMSAPAIKKSRTSPTAVFTGTWTNPSGYTYGKTTSQNGAKFKDTFNGDALYLGHMLHNAVVTQSTADVYVDGNLVGTITPYSGISTSLGQAFATGCARFSGLGAGAHEVEVVVTSPTGKIFYIDYVVGSEDLSDAKTKLSNVMRMSDARYTSWGISDAVINDYNMLLSGLVSQLSGDGMNIVLVDNHSIIDRDTDLSDGVHPNAGGHVKLNKNFASA